MSTIFRAPELVGWDGRRSVFLAGTIDNGDSPDWQKRVETSLSDLDVLVLNPRRSEWGSSW